MPRSTGHMHPHNHRGSSTPLIVSFACCTSPERAGHPHPGQELVAASSSQGVFVVARCSDVRVRAVDLARAIGRTAEAGRAALGRFVLEDAEQAAQQKGGDAWLASVRTSGPRARARGGPAERARACPARCSCRAPRRPRRPQGTPAPPLAACAPSSRAPAPRRTCV